MPVGSLEISEYISDEDLDVLEEGLTSHAQACGCPAYEETPLSILKRDDDDTIVAGLTGATVWNWLYIDILWVDEKLRGQKVGSALLRAAEEEALRRGCHSAYLWTESFQAEGFYKKQGFIEFVVKDDFPVGHKRIGFMKRLAT